MQNNKSDYLDAEAIAEAVQRPRMRFVPIKTEEQLDLQALHRVRERWVMRRTAVVNQIRSLLLERGLTLPKGRSHLNEQLPRILEDAELHLSGSFRVLLAQLQLELEQLAARIEEMDLSHALETRYRRRSIRGRPLYEDESERISIMARSQRLHSRPNTLAQTNCHRIFRLQLCGGPYISGNRCVNQAHSC